MPTQWSEAEQAPLGCIAPHTAQRCHSEPVTDVTGVGIRIPAPAGAEIPASLFGRFKGKGFLRKGGNRNPPFLKPFFGHFLSGKKVTRRRQKRKKEGKPTGGAEPRPYTHLSMACAYTFRANRAARPYALKCRRASPKSPSAPHFPKMQIIFYCGEKKPLIS